MEPRIDYRTAAPDGFAALVNLERYTRVSGLEPSLLELVKLRASQINGCAYCIDMHTKDARHRGNRSSASIRFLSGARRLSSASGSVRRWPGPKRSHKSAAIRSRDRVYQLAREQFGEKELVDLTLALIAINGWNRLAIGFRMVPGTYQPQGQAVSKATK
jgi:AhpD family alkylhydroperoxidase